MTQLYTGFLPMKDKAPLIKFSEAVPLEQVQECEEYGGVLAPDTILIDIDDSEQADIVWNLVQEKNIKCNVYNTTRGKHFVFLNKTRNVDKCYTHAQSVIGVSVDIKVGSGGKKCVHYLKSKGKLREQILTVDTPDELPYWLRPVSKKVDFFSLGDGDGRNQTLFNYILTLQSEGLSKDEIKESIRIINKLILKEPLDDREIEVIIRDDSFQAPVFFKKGTFLHDKFANYFMSTHNIITINGRLHIYKDGVYVPDDKEIEGRMIDLIPKLKAHQRKEALKYMELKLRQETEVSDVKYLAFKNGILDLETDDLLGFSPDIVLTNKIPFNYNPGAYSELMDKTLDKLACNDRAVRDLLEEVAGYTFYRRNELRKMFILIGDKQNGKSTYLDMIQTMLGEDNYTNLDLKDIGDRFRTAELFGKLANLGDDIDDAYIEHPALLKKVVSGESVLVERKGQDPFSFKPYDKLIFCANSIPRIKDNSGAVLSRMIIVPFNAYFSVDQPDFDPFLKYKLQKPECIEYLIKVGIQGLKRVLFARKFTESKKVAGQLTEYEQMNNPILIFFEEYGKDEFILKSPKEVYLMYQSWCEDNGFKAVSSIAFGKQISKTYGLETHVKRIKGKPVRVYVDTV